MALIVVAEDDRDIREVMTRVLRRAGHTVVETDDGVAALEAVREQRPDILVSDIDMPRMSGVELSRAVRDEPATRELPVVFVSGSLAPGDARPVQAEVTAVLFKPFVPRELSACVEKALQSGHVAGQEPSVCP
ncbi:response regulator [Actinoplanes philippinensis]|uniref:response regulator n=1 Tax=Actinoplanes philippinensis TaxID=35752 RepID=UPI0034089A77